MNFFQNESPKNCCGCCCCRHFWYCASNNSNSCTDLDSHSENSIFDTNDHTKLVSECGRKHKQKCLNSKFQAQQQLWIAFTHICCTAVLVVLAILWTTDIFTNGKNNISVQMLNETSWRLSHLSDNDGQFNKTHPISISLTSTVQTPNPDDKDKCEPLYTLVYVHCCVWFLFLILDHVARHMHHKTLRCRGHLKAYARFTRLAAVPFQLVSLWTVLLAIFIAVYAQQDKADMEPYCDANFLMSPKNGVAVLLIIEFIFVAISSLVYANSIRKFNAEKPPPDVCGWEEKDDIHNRWTPRALRSESTIGSQSSSRISNSQDLLEQKDSRCILDLLEYYAHANRELAANLGRTSQKLRQLELEIQQSQSPTSETIEELP